MISAILALLLWQYRVIDGFWFTYMTEDYSPPA
jgi:hypothetical protein